MPEENQTQENETSNESTQQQNQDDSTEENISSEENEEPPFHPHRGKIMRVLPYTELVSLSFDKSYEDSTANGKVELVFESKDQMYIYDGVSCKLKLRRDTDRQFSSTGIEEIFKKEEDVVLREHYPTEEQLADAELTTGMKEFVDDDAKDFDVDSTIVCRSASDDGLYGFVTEVKHTNKSSEVSVKDWGYCLEDTGKKLSFGGMFRSEVIGEVIKSYGLTPIIDFTGLEDDLITWTNMKSTGTSSGSSNDGTATDSENHTHCSSPLDLSSDCKVSSKGEIPSDITENALGKIGQEDSNYGQWAKGKTPQEVLQGLREGFKWQNYSVTKEGSCATDTFELGKIRANCGDSARLVKCCMDVIGVDCIVIHCPGHFYNAIKVDGTWYTCDLTNRSQCKTKTGTNKFGY